MSSIEEKIRKFGQNQDTEELQEFISTIDINELLDFIQRKLNNPNFGYTWNYVLQGFTQSSDSHKKRFEVVMKVMKELENNDVSNQHNKDIITRLCMELSKCKTEHLVKLCDFCIECLQAQKMLQMSWKELMPELVNILSAKEHIEYNDVEISGLEYKKQLINSMCMLQWFPANVTPLTEMFVDMTLSKEEHLQIVNKLGTYLEKLTPQEIPSFVYQFLRLCRHNNGRIIFFKLQQYFNVRLKDLSNEQTDSDRSDFDAIEDSSNQDAVEAEGTVLYHIHSAASLGQESIKDYLASIKNLLRSPESIIEPFQLTVLLTISTISHYEEKVFEIIRSCISRHYHEEQKKNSSAWFREMVSNTRTVENVFAHIINASADDRDLVLKGLVSFAFVLMGVGSALGRDLIAEKQWQLGSMILFKIIKRKRHFAPVIIEELSNRIISNQSVMQYIECVYMLSKNVTLLMLENKTLVLSLIDGLVEMPGNNAKQLLDALIPLTKVSPTIRDHFIILLRKVLYSKVVETRQVAVIGFLKLLTNLKISNLAALSQNSFTGSYSSGHSLFTQISMHTSTQCAPSAFSNEALCLEVLGILRRCFMQQSEVRAQLYEGLFDAVILNPELGIPILEMMFLHFRDFYNIDDEILPPLKFDKITLTKDITVTLQEPVGKLIYSIGLIVTVVAITDSESTAVSRFTKILESLCKRMSQCDLVHLELDDGTDLLDIMPEAQHKLLVLKEAMSVYEALIGYKFYSWELGSEDNGKQISGLFLGYQRLSSFLKNISKPKKADAKKKKDPNKTTQQTVNNTTTKKDGPKSPKPTKMPETTIDFHVLKKMLSLLHEPIVSWTTIVQANIVKSKREFHQHVMQATLNVLTSTKNKKILDVEAAKNIYGHLCDIALIIYERIIKRLSDFIDFDCVTAVLAVECFALIFNTIANNYTSNFQSFLSRIGGKNKSEELEIHLTEFVETYQKLFQMDEEVSEDPEIKKMSLAIMNTLHSFTHQIPNTNNVLSIQMIDWLKNYAINNTIPNRPVATSFINLLFDYHIKVKSSLTVFVDIAVRLGDVTGVINEEEHNSGEFNVINEATANTVFMSLCSSVKAMLEDIDWIIARLKAEFTTMTTYSSQGDCERRRDELKERECGVCCQLCFIVTILTHLSNCTVPPGNLSEAILKNLTLLYCTLGSLTKYFSLRSSKTNPVYQRARFERVVKLAGKQLAPVVYKFIMYIEESQKQETSPKKKKKAPDSSSLKSKILKETRLIPKLVYEIEQFSKFVMQLSKKTKIDLSRLVGQGTVRDFRILHLKEVLEKANDGDPSTQMTEGSDISLNESSINDVDGEDESPPTKKKKAGS